MPMHGRRSMSDGVNLTLVEAEALARWCLINTLENTVVSWEDMPELCEAGFDALAEAFDLLTETLVRQLSDEQSTFENEHNVDGQELRDRAG